MIRCGAVLEREGLPEPTTPGAILHTFVLQNSIRMPNYFAHGNKFFPPKGEKDRTSLESVSGFLISCDTRPGNNTSGYWFVFRLKKNDDYYNIFFEPSNIDDADLDRYITLRGKSVTIRSSNEKPIIGVVDIESEDSLRATLLKGVASGNVQAEDLPALLDFSKGKDGQFEKWLLFKQQVENDGLSKTKETIAQKAREEQKSIDREKAELDRLLELYQSVSEEKNKVLQMLVSEIVFLQGEDGLEGTNSMTYYGDNADNLVRIDHGYQNLMEAFERFKTRKGVYVICDGHIHLIHHAYLEDKGRAFLIGSSKEYLKTKPEEVKKLVDKIYQALHGNNPYQL